MGEEKIVLDTSVLIAGLLGSHVAKDILISILRGEVLLVVSDEIFEEYLRAIHYDKIVDRIDLYEAYLFLVSCIE